LTLLSLLIYLTTFHLECQIKPWLLHSRMTTNISDIPDTGYSVSNPLNGTDVVAQDSGKIFFGVCLQLNHHIVGSNYLSYNPPRNDTQPLNHLLYPFRFYVDQNIRIRRHWLL